MAEKRTIDINIKNNADEATQDFNQFNEALDETAKSAKNVNSTFEEVYGDLQPLTTRLGEAEDRLYELALAGDTTSKEYQELLTKVGEYRKVQIKTDLAVDSAATTLGQKLGGALTGATSGFAAVQGVMGLVGGESEALEKALLRVQSALAIQQGVQGIREAIPAFKQLGRTAKTALQGIKAEVAATGIGLLVIAVGTLVAYWDDITAAMGGAAAEGQQLLNQAVEQAEYANKQYQDSVKYADILRAEGKTEEEILAIQEKKLKGAIVEAETAVKNAKLQKDLAIESTKFNQQVLQGILTVMLSPIETLIFTYNQIASVVPGLSKIGSLAETLSTTFFDVEDTAKEADAAIAQAETALNDLRLAEVQFQKDKKAKRQSRFKQEQQDLTKHLEEMDRIRDAANAKRIAKEDAQFQLELELMKDRELAEIIALTQAYDKKFAIADGNAELERQLTEQQEKDIAAIKKRYRDAEQSQIDEANALSIEKEKERRAQQLEDIIAYQEAEQSIRMANLDNAAAGIDLLKDLAGKNRKLQAAAIAAENAVGIAKIIMSTQAANAAAKLKYAAIPGGVALAAAEITANKISAGIGIAASVAAAAKGIASLKESASLDSGGDLGGDAGTEVIAPEFNVVGDAGINQLAQLQQQPTQAYVVSGEVTSAQALDRNRVTNATL